MLILEDNGCGMRPEQREGHDSLGLRLIRSLAVQMEGTAEIESPIVKLRGTRITISIPLTNL